MQVTKWWRKLFWQIGHDETELHVIELTVFIFACEEIKETKSFPHLFFKIEINVLASACGISSKFVERSFTSLVNFEILQNIRSSHDMDSFWIFLRPVNRSQWGKWRTTIWNKFQIRNNCLYKFLFIFRIMLTACNFCSKWIVYFEYIWLSARNASNKLILFPIFANNVQNFNEHFPSITKTNCL